MQDTSCGVAHLIKLIDAANAVVGEHQRSPEREQIKTNWLGVVNQVLTFAALTDECLDL